MESPLALVGARDLLAGGIGVALAVYYTSADAPLHRYALVAVVVLVAALRIGFLPRLVRLVERVAGTAPLEVVSKHDLTRRSHHSARRHRSHRTKRHHRRRQAPSSDAPSAAEGTDTPATSGAGIGQDNTAFPASAPLNLNASMAQIALHEPGIAMDRQHPAALPPAMHEAAAHQGNNSSSSSSSSSDADEPPHTRRLDAVPGAQESTGVSEFADAPATLDIHRHHRHHHRHHHHRASRHSRHSRRHHNRPHRSHRHEQEHVPSAERAADVDIRSRLERLRRRLARHQALLERITVPGDEGAVDARAQAEADAAEEEEEEWEESEDEESSESDGEFDAGLAFAATFGGATHVSVGNAVQGILNEVCSDSPHADSATMSATLRNVLRFVRDDRKNGHDIPQDVLTLPMFEHFFELFGRRSTSLATVVEVSAQPWFHPTRTKVEMEGLLAGLAEGTFLVSLGEGKVYDFVLHRVMRDGAILSVPLLACKDGLSLPMRLPQLPDKRQTRMVAPLDILDAADRPAPNILEFIRLQIVAGRIRDHSSSAETGARM